MATADAGGAQAGPRGAARGPGFLSRARATLKVRLAPVLQFTRKVTNDWLPTFAGMLTYSLLTSAFSLLLVIIAIGGLILGSISPAAQQQLQQRISSSLPVSNGAAVVTAVTNRLTQSAGILLIVAVALAVYSGSRVFVKMEKSFDIFFRVQGRRGIQQNIMAIGMMLLYAVLVPLVLATSIVPPTLLAILRSLNAQFLSGPIVGLLLQIAGLAISVLVALVLFGAIYVVVPNRPLRPKAVWKGTLVAAVLLMVDNALFPLYISVFLKPENRGSIVGLLIVILAYYYFQSLIVLIGAEVNAWAYGFKKPLGSLDAIVEGAQKLRNVGKWHVSSGGTPQLEGGAALTEDLGTR
jgi:membrane protein